MWRLLRDQWDRDIWKVLVFVTGALLSPLLTGLLGVFDALPRRGSQVIAYYGFYFWVFSGGYSGVSSMMADRRGLRVIRALPVQSRAVARASWLGATAPAIVIGGLAYVSLVIVDVMSGRALEFPLAPGTLSVPEAAAFTLVWACSVSAIAWGLVMLTIRYDQRLAIASVNLLFWLVWFLLLSPSIWRWLTVHPGGSLRDVLGQEQAVRLFIVAGLAVLSFVLSPRLAAHASLSRSALVSSWSAARPDPKRLSLTRSWTGGAEVPRMFGVVLAFTLAGLLFMLVLPLPGETPFLVRQTFMLIWLYVVPALWVSTWLPATRVFRCLPLSRIRLAALPVMYAMLICLAGGISVAVVMVLTERATRVFTPLLWWLLLCPGLLSLFYGVALRSGPVRSASYGLGIWTMLVVTGNLTRDFFFMSRAFRSSLPSMGLSEPFWPAAIAGLLLALVGYLALWRSLVMHAPYRPVPQSERGS
jgi:hypothetical protein